MNKSNFLGKNLRYLRKLRGLNQDEMQTGTGITRGTWSNYEKGDTEPSLDTILTICQFFNVSVDGILLKNLEFENQNVDLIKNNTDTKSAKNVDRNVDRNVDPNPDLHITMAAEPDSEYVSKSSIIPITDISVAAGSGVFNSEFIDHVDSLRLPGALVKKGFTYLCVKIKGLSMSPTLQDGGFVIIRLLDRAEWAKMPDERLFVVSDNDGKSYLKRVKNRFKQDFIVLKSDNPDQASFPNFNLTTGEINSIWYVEWYLSAKMPNIHDQYYSRLQKLEDIVDELARKVK